MAEARRHQDRRNLADSLVELFVIGEADIEIHYKFPDFLKEPTKDEQIKQAPTSMNSAAPVEPEFIRLPKQGKLCPRTGLTRSKLNALILPTQANGYRPPVQSKSLRTHQGGRGVRLINWQSLKKFLEAQ